MKKVLLFHSLSHNPYENMALESFFLENKKKEDKILFLWRNAPCIFFGRFQNPWREINLPLVKKDNIPILRRRSGGGCVFHDLGNLNISLLSSPEEKEKSSELLLQILRQRGAGPYLGEKGDLLLQGKKFSGSAYYHHKNAFLHHCTMLFSSNLSLLKNYLSSPWEEHIITQAVASRKAQVTNLGSYGLEMDGFLLDLQKSLRTGFWRISRPIQFMGEGYWEKFREEFYQKKWIFDKTPAFFVKNPCDREKLMIACEDIPRGDYAEDWPSGLRQQF